MKYASFDKDGFPTAFYDTEINGENIPKAAVEISDKDWMEFINNQGARAWDGSKVISKFRQVNLTMEDIRKKRKSLLSASDWTALNDAPLDESKRRAWNKYRQELRDITNQKDPNAIKWPDQPK